MKAFILSIATVLVFGLSSCGETCTTCTITYEANGESISQTQPEVCGTKGVVKEYKDGMQSLADQTAALVGGTSASSSCVDN
ncbi:MAG: hypothetical protein R3B93_09640 [Bacteroidia bacterium]